MLHSTIGACHGHRVTAARHTRDSWRTSVVLCSLWQGAVWSEVKEERRAQPDSGDMSATRCPAAASPRRSQQRTH
jgi:hypothetical protein